MHLGVELAPERAEILRAALADGDAGLIDRWRDRFSRIPDSSRIAAGVLPALLDALKDAAAKGADADALSALAQAYAAVAAKLDAGTARDDWHHAVASVVETLKWPAMGGEPDTALIGALGAHAGAPADFPKDGDVWAFVAWVNRQHPDIDVGAPLAITAKR